MSDAERLAGWIETWWDAIDDFTQLLEEIPEADWTNPTDLPGWSVHDIAAHTAHLEAVLAGAPEETVDVGEPGHVTNPMGIYTEQGVVARRGATPDELINEIRESTTKRRTELLDDPPTDGSAKPSRVFGGVDWDWNTLLRNRPLDVWMHEQDIRRAVGRPGNLDTAGAKHTIDYLLDALPVIVGKRVAPPPGTTVSLVVLGFGERSVEIGEDGRARPVTGLVEPSAAIEMAPEEFIVMAGGRRTPADVTYHGDTTLAESVVESYRTTP
ncbi:maleylpyruvate isomerase family mycothiol-dependent enzyme [Nocardioides sp. AE5]|uniref:maleylpyruvate isomerase family mycothiol-dependent enzyme n=1 Tax=Nocardioides sp. AE5 TaxID=2962573 RepID=UPI0028810B4B|nr:maleylpyruvate isomerase family mycothiol-dependent enzyme [Nocardioides sp. AE5]MDT0203456.1 maleylpyruvate isomerase family mycothiol-dependent enzyme [Nocardioides sp. AE5]